MNSFASRAGLRLEWVQPRTFIDWFELREGGKTLATLCFEGMLGTLATVETARGAWSFEEAGCLNQGVEVRDGASGSLMAAYYPGASAGGELVLADGRRLTWESTDFWGTRWHFVDPEGREPALLQEGVEHARRKDLLRQQATVATGDSRWQPGELALLTSLGWYLMLKRRRRAEVMTSTVCAVAM